jgi:hypothetical protein
LRNKELSTNLCVDSTIQSPKCVWVSLGTAKQASIDGNTGDVDIRNIRSCLRVVSVILVKQQEIKKNKNLSSLWNKFRWFDE